MLLAPMPVPWLGPQGQLKLAREKLNTTESRDRETDYRLNAAGWLVIRVWEHEPVECAADRVEEVLNNHKSL